MADKDNPNGTCTKITSSGGATSRTMEIDNRLRFEDGRIYITSTPYEGGRQSDFPEKMDVTELVAKAIAPFIGKVGNRPRYIIRINQEYLELLYVQQCINTMEEKRKFLHRVIGEISDFLSGKGPDTIIGLTFMGSDGQPHKSFTVEEVEEGEPELAVIEDISGNEVERVKLGESKDEEDDIPAGLGPVKYMMAGNVISEKVGDDYIDRITVVFPDDSNEEEKRVIRAIVIGQADDILTNTSAENTRLTEKQLCKEWMSVFGSVYRDFSNKVIIERSLTGMVTVTFKAKFIY